MTKLLIMVAFLITAIGHTQTEPTTTWKTPLPPKIEVGKTYPVAAQYDAGNDGSGTDYTLKGNIQFSISEKTGDKYQWRAGTNVLNTMNTHSGFATKDWTIPSLPPSTTLTKGTTYVLRVGYQNDNHAWAKSSNEYPITISPEKPGTIVSTVNAVDFISSDIILKATEKLEIMVKYTSQKDIAVNGIKFSLWTVTNPFSDVMHGIYTNKKVLPAGTNLTTTITVSPPETITTNGIIWTSATLASQDPNENDPQYTGPIKDYFYQLRMIKGSDHSFTPHLKKVQSTLTIIR